VVAVSSQAAFGVSLVSRNSKGVAANGDSSTEGATLLSRDGRLVAFISRAANLPAGDGSTDRAYVRDFRTGRTSLVSRTTGGEPATGGIGGAAISASGRFVAFAGLGTGLPGASATFSEVWIHDRRTGATALASRGAGGKPGSGSSSNPSLSAGGRFVAFESHAANLPGGDGVEERVYVRDMKRGKTILASRTESGDPADATAYGQLLSADGRKVVFASDDPDLPGGGGFSHAYLRDLDRRVTRIIDRNGNGEIADNDGGGASISPGGRFVAFRSQATNLPGGDGIHQQVYLRDLTRGRTILISRNNAGDPFDLGASDGRVSADGRLVAFNSDSTNTPGGGPDFQVYVRDLRGGRTRLLSRDSNGDPADDDSYYPSISADGNSVSFDSEANNLGGRTAVTNIYRVTGVR
jgi:Tol biopolymer transport system component